MAKESKCIVCAGHQFQMDFQRRLMVQLWLSLRLVGISGVVSHLHELRD